MKQIVVGHTLKSGKEFKVDADQIIMGRTLLASLTRYGKSYTNRRLIEQLFGKAGIVIVDLEGEYASLREKFPFLIIGKDVPLQVETAEFLAETTLKENLSVIIDLSLTDDDEAKEYVSAFVKRFMFLETRLRKPYLFVIEEADELCPEKGVAKATSLKAIKNVAKKGGKRGVGLIITTHRPAWVSKGVISQCTTLKAIGRIEWKSDLDTLKEFLQIPSEILRRPRGKDDKPIDDGKPHIDSLSPGEFFIAGSAVEHDDFVKVSPVLTTHLGATPNLLPPTPKELTSVVKRLSETLPKIIEEKIKPALPPMEEITKKAEEKAEKKIGRKFQKKEQELNAKISKLKSAKTDLTERIEKLSRQAAISPAEPIKDALEHPIVKRIMNEMTDRARDLLVKIEREPDLTREQLAAFLHTSRDTVANIIKYEINRVFKQTVIVGSGRPIRYQSVLKRLYITDVARREISEIEQLNTKITDLNKKNSELTNINRSLNSENLSLREERKKLPKSEEIQKLRRKVGEQKQKIGGMGETIRQQNQQLKVYKRGFESIRKNMDSIEKQTPRFDIRKFEKSHGDGSHPTAVEIVAEPMPFEKLPEPTEEETKDDAIIHIDTTSAKETIVNLLRQNKGTFFTAEELKVVVEIPEEPFDLFLSLKSDSRVEFDPEKGYRAVK